MRLDIFVRYANPSSALARLYVGAVTPLKSKAIIAALERDGEKVVVYRNSKSGLGKLVYETPQA